MQKLLKNWYRKSNYKYDTQQEKDYPHSHCSSVDWVLQGGDVQDGEDGLRIGGGDEPGKTTG